PSQDGDSWAKYAESDNKEMDEGLKEALESMAAASAVTGGKTAAAVSGLQKSAKESAKGMQQALADFFRAIGQGFTHMYVDVTSVFNFFGDRIAKVFARDDRSQEEKAAAEVCAERVTKARGAFKKEMQEVKTAFETGVKEAKEKASRELVGTALERAVSIGEVRTALGNLQNAALGTMDKVEAAVREATSGVQESLRRRYGREVREASQVLDVQEQKKVDGVLETLSGKVRTDAFVFDHAVTQALGTARSKAKDLTAKTMQEVAEKESAEIARIREEIKSSTDMMRRAFESFFTGMTDRLTSLSSAFGEFADDVLDGIIGEEVSREDADGLRALASSAKAEAQAAVIKGCGSAVVAQGSIRNEIKKLNGVVDDLKGVESLETVRDILAKFQRNIGKAAGSAMDEIKRARGTIQEQANKFVGEVGKHGANAGLGAREQLNKQLEKLQAEMKKQTEGVSIKEELERVREAVIRQQAAQSQRTIADIPHEALATVPLHKDVCTKCAKIGEAVAGEWGTQWSEVVAADSHSSHSIAHKKAIERIAGARTSLVVAFYGFMDSIQRSHAEIVEAFRGFFKFIEQSFKSMEKSVSGRISSVVAEATSEEKKVWWNLQSRVKKGVAVVDAALKKVRQQIDQALNTANQEVRNVQDLNAARDVLGTIVTSFQKSVTLAAAEALKTVETQVKDIEQEFEKEYKAFQEQKYKALVESQAHKDAAAKLKKELNALSFWREVFDSRLEKEYKASAERVAAQRKAEASKAMEADAEFKKFLKNSSAHKEALATLAEERVAMPAEQKKFDRSLKAEYDGDAQRRVGKEAWEAELVAETAKQKELDEGLLKPMYEAARLRRAEWELEGERKEEVKQLRWAEWDHNSAWDIAGAGQWARQRWRTYDEEQYLWALYLLGSMQHRQELEKQMQQFEIFSPEYRKVVLNLAKSAGQRNGGVGEQPELEEKQDVLAQPQVEQQPEVAQPAVQRPVANTQQFEQVKQAFEEMKQLGTNNASIGKAMLGLTGKPKEAKDLLPTLKQLEKLDEKQKTLTAEEGVKKLQHDERWDKAVQKALKRFPDAPEQQQDGAVSQEAKGLLASAWGKKGDSAEGASVGRAEQGPTGAQDQQYKSTWGTANNRETAKKEFEEAKRRLAEMRKVAAREGREAEWEQRVEQYQSNAEQKKFDASLEKEYKVYQAKLKAERRQRWQEKLDREFEKALSDPERKSNAEREL
ncbi:MAG: hypothetical protein ACTJLL_00390, partial [Anaplasma sp.]